jgi:hypothetical protein
MTCTAATAKFTLITGNNPITAINAVVAEAQAAGHSVLHIAEDLVATADILAIVLSEVRHRASRPNGSAAILLVVDIGSLLKKQNLPMQHPPGHRAVVRWRQTALAQQAVRANLTYLAKEGPAAGVSLAVVAPDPERSLPAAFLSAVNFTIRTRAPTEGISLPTR